MTTIFGEQAVLQAKGSNISLTPPKRAGIADGNPASNAALILEGVGNILSALPKEDKIGKLATSVDTRVRAVEADDTLNDFQKSDKKSRILNTARAKAGPENRTFIDSIFDGARTKKEVSPVTGQVQFVNVGTGEVVKLGTDTAEGMQVQTLQKQSETIQEFFPAAADQMEIMLNNQSADNIDPVAKESAVSNVMSEFSEVAGVIQSIHDRTNLAMNLPAEQQQSVVNLADKEYLQASTKLFNVFHSDVFIDSLRGPGGITPEDMMELVNSAERDFIDEVTSNGLPTDTPKLQQHMRTMREDLRELYTSAVTSDLNALNRKKDTLKAKVDITEASFLNNNPDIVRLKTLEKASTAALSMITLKRDLQAKLGRGTPEENASVARLITGADQFTTNAADTFQKALQFTESSTQEIASVKDGLVNAPNEIQFIGTLDRVKRLLNSPYSVSRTKELKEILNNEFIVGLDRAVEKGWMPEEQRGRLMGQFNNAVSKNISQIREMGETEESWAEKILESTAELSAAVGRTFFGKGNIERAELTPDGKLKELDPEPVKIIGADDEK